ncbi:hypothetical protein KJ359_007553 [Pestalotiopsis sp. 9143b]|nr:hypothetical protein KJ359_007553 [Pestalotiopsis sp. 9143b]
MVGWYPGPTERGTLSLVYSCLLTIFTCTWTVLHLNVPGHDDFTITRFLRKAKWMAITILLPEFIFAKAVCELRLALKDYRETRESFATINPENLTWEALDSSQEYGIRKTWKVVEDETRAIRFLYCLMGLGPWKSASKNDTCGYRPIQKQELDSDGTGIQSTGTQTTRSDPIATSHNAENDRTRETGHQIQTRWREETQLWTLTHTYLANMGGLLYWKCNGKACALTGSKLGRQFRWGSGPGDHAERAESVAHPLKGLSLQAEDIADKSKADWLLKGLSMLQISSLALTVVTRGAANLPLTQLEIATLAFAIFAVATFAANWWKPKDVSRPVWAPRISSGAQPKFHERMRDFSVADMDNTQSFLVRLGIPHWARTSEGFILDLPRVGNDVVDMEGDVPVIVVLVAISALVFGAVHCSAWNFEFPTRAELILWRIASVLSTLVPLVSLLVTSSVTYLTTSLVDARAVASLAAEMKRLEAWPDEYLRAIIDPAFRQWPTRMVPATPESPAHWATDYLVSTMVMVHRLSEDCQLDREPDAEEIDQVWNHKRLDELRTTAESMCQFESAFERFLELMKRAKGNEREAKLLRCLEDNMFDIFRNLQWQRDLWKKLENSYVKPMVPVAGKEGVEDTAVGDLVTALRAFKDRSRAHDRARYLYEIVSISVVGGLVYIAARLVILVLLFTTLRSVPVGVYENTPWTIFIPSFS